MQVIQQAALDWLWGMWRQLGVPGVVRLPRSVVVDPEWLVVATPSLAESDPRLQEQALGWCVQHHGWISTRRLHTVASRVPDDMRESFGAFERQVGTHSDARWGALSPVVGDMPTLRVRSVAIPFDAKGALALRVRAGLGLGVRSDLLVELMRRAGSWARVAELAEVTGYTKRSVSRTLVDFEAAGWVRSRAVGNAHVFSLSHPQLFGEMFHADGVGWTDWSQVVLLLFELLKLEGASQSGDATRRLAAQQSWEPLRQRALALGVALPPDPRGRADAFDAMSSWGIRVWDELQRADDASGGS